MQLFDRKTLNFSSFCKLEFTQERGLRRGRVPIK